MTGTSQTLMVSLFTTLSELKWATINHHIKLECAAFKYNKGKLPIGTDQNFSIVRITQQSFWLLRNNNRISFPGGCWPFESLHGEGQGFVELLNNTAGRVQAAILELERVAVSLVGEAGELRREKGGVVVGHDLGRSTPLRMSAQGIGGRRRGRWVEPPLGYTNHHLLRWQGRRVLPTGHTVQLHWLARIWRDKRSAFSFIYSVNRVKSNPPHSAALEG